MTVAQHTRVYRTTWGLSRVGTGVVRLGISAVRRSGPLVEVTTAGLLVAGPPQALTVRAPTAALGQGTAIAQTDLPTQAESLAFTADGRLVVAGSDGNLYQVDPVTGASTADWPDGRRGGERHEPAGLPAAVGAGVAGAG